MHILIVDDERPLRESLARLLERRGWHCTLAANGLEARALLQETPFDLVLSDLIMSEMNGLELLAWCRDSGPDIPFVMLSAHAGMHEAIEALRLGARDFLVKPFDSEELALRVEKVVTQSREERLVKRPDPAPASRPASSGVMARIETMVARAAPSPSVILINGESGTGKEVWARRIHSLSKRANGPFVGVNLGSIPDTLVESELFGHEKGAFSGALERRRGLFESAAGGTIFLDEIGEMPLQAQVKLLRVLQERTIMRLGGTVPIPVDARILAATNRDLEAAVKAGTFREDLYYRLNVVRILLPPLRERKDDIPRLTEEILRRLGNELGRGNLNISPEALAILLCWDYPGNIRELANILERAAIFCSGSTIESADIDLGGPEKSAPAPVARTLAAIEAEAIRQALERHGGNRSLAAKELGISRRTLFNKLQPEDQTKSES